MEATILGTLPIRTSIAIFATTDVWLVLLLQVLNQGDARSTVEVIVLNS